MLDQYVTCADFLRLMLQVRRSGKSANLCFCQSRRRIPDGLLRQVIVVIGHPARIRETNFPVGLRNHKGHFYYPIVPQCKNMSTYHACQIDGGLCSLYHRSSFLPMQGGVTTIRDHVNKTRPATATEVLHASRPSAFLQAIEPPRIHYTHILSTPAFAINNGDHSHVHLQHADDRGILHDCVPLHPPRSSMAIRTRAPSSHLAHRLVPLFSFLHRQDRQSHCIVFASGVVFSWLGQPGAGRGYREALQACPHSRGSRSLRPCLDHWAIPRDRSGGQHRKRGDDSAVSPPRPRYALLVHDLRRQHLGDILSLLESGQYSKKGILAPHLPAYTLS